MLDCGLLLVGHLTHAVSSRLQATGITNAASSQQHDGLSSSGGGVVKQSGSSVSAVGPYFSSAGTGAAVAPPASSTATGSVWDVSSMIGGPAVDNSSTGPATGLGQHISTTQEQQQQVTASHGGDSSAAVQRQQQQDQQDVIVLRTLLKQQQEIAQLKMQNKQLRKAVCKLDFKAPFCDGAGRSGRSRKLQAAVLLSGKMTTSF